MVTRELWNITSGRAGTAPLASRRGRVDPITAATPFPAAVRVFLCYLESYRAASPHTIHAYRADLQELIEFLGGPIGVPPPAAVTRELVLAWAVSLQSLASSTIRRKLAAVASFYTYLQDMGAVAHNPTRRIPLPRVVQRLPPTLSDEQSRILVAVAASGHPWEHCALVLLLSTGLRRAELAAVRLRDVDLLTETLLVRGKGGTERLVPLCAAGVTAIALYLPCRIAPEGVDTLLTNCHHRPLTGHLIGRMLERVRERAGIHERITPHHLRHTFATRLVREGVDVRTVQELLGHSSLQTTARYLHSRMESKREAVEIAARAFSPPSPRPDPELVQGNVT